MPWTPSGREDSRPFRGLKLTPQVTGSGAPADLNFRAARKGDGSALLALLRESFTDWPRFGSADLPAHLYWKLDSSPLARSLHVVAESQGRVIAALLYLVQEVWVGGRVFVARQAVDSCVHPQFRGRGVMAALRRLSWEKSLPHVDLQFGPVAGDAIVALDQYERAQMFGAKIDVVSLGERGLLETRSGVGRGRTWTVRELPSFDARVDTLWNRAFAHYDFVVKRSAVYLNWRYSAPVAGPYTLLMAEEEERLAGYLVLRPGTTAGIADVCVAPGRTDVLNDLLMEVCTKLRRNEVRSLECWLPRGHIYQDALRTAGFVKRRTMRVTFGPVRADASSFDGLRSRDARVHFMAGDTDLV